MYKKWKKLKTSPFMIKETFLKYSMITSSIIRITRSVWLYNCTKFLAKNILNVLKLLL